MAIKDVMVHVDASPHVQTRIATAVRLAESQNARLTGFYVVTPPDVPDFIRAHLGNEIVERQHRMQKDVADKTKSVFDATCSGSRIDFSWKTADGDLSENLCSQVRYHDIILLGQHDIDSDVQPGSEKLPDSVIMTSGRPVMVIPSAYTVGEIGRKLLVAWDASRQAVRAVSDTLPLLVSAEKVVVLVVSRQKDDAWSGNETTGVKISRHLRHHGVKVEPKEVHTDEHETGQVILAEATAEGCDGIIMGAWGHQRWKETVLGGVTRYIMENMDRPVIMSH